MGEDKWLYQPLAGYQLPFPNLVQGEYRVTSPEDDKYNCISYAADDNALWWTHGERTTLKGFYWPPGAMHGDQLGALISCFECIGYSICNNDSVEKGYDKVALYADKQGNWTHAAKQLPDGSWTSKLGEGVDIIHDNLEGVSGRLYGHVACFMKRPIRENDSAQKSTTKR